ncbi:putative nuclear pore complex protein [Lyophyllum shimeji]|uniref:Nuclear pore complex protein n=1 Tax=Lyophyllum shimeji TaxID=47721 RepID=A0A9P3UI97_LYOSH|nr:putative nuclear pore complex protein [Lyophyllum shimeji]
MDADFSDILGGPTSPNVREGGAGRWTSVSFGVKSALVAVVLLVVYVAAIRAWRTFLIWREKAYKLSMRRRHGIPDNDHRPFNVAYAAVVRARQESEAEARRGKLHEMVRDQQNALPEQNVRQRHGIQRDVQTTRPTAIPGRYESVDFPSTSANASNINYPYRPFSTHADSEEHYHPTPTVRIAEPEVDTSLPKSGPSRRPTRKYMTVSDDEGLKRGFDGNESEDGADHLKKTRVSDEEPEWHERYQLSQRGSKRVFGDEDDYQDASQSAPPRDKRQRKFSLEKTRQDAAEEMDIDEEEDEVAELRPTVRGRKRDRAEAGSTFGGDDDDSAHGAEVEDDSKARRRHRKRRTYAKRKSDAGMSARGQKRDRDLGEEDSEVEYDDGVALKVSRKKRGKRSVSTFEPDDPSDLSMDDSQASSSRGRPRQIGDEWESNGVRYKIGPNGQRLRQTLIKKARQKFNMPKDSQHPDREANLEVCIETWLTEEEYREAKDQLLLAWQDSNKPSAEPETPSRDSQDLPPAAGKDLLWKSTSVAPSTGTSTPRKITPPPGSLQGKQTDLYSQSIASNVGLRINPFQRQLVTSGKRIASSRVSSVYPGVATHPSSPVSPSLSLVDSTNGSPRHKMYSKWEKQDLEAKAMMKMREANRKKEEEKKLKEEQEKAEKQRREQETAAAPQPIPTITVTKPDEVKTAQAATKPPAFSFGPPPAADVAKKDAAVASFGTSSAPPPEQTKVASAPSFSFPAQPSQPTKPALFSLNTAPQGGVPSKPADNIFGAKPNQQPSKPPVTFGFPASAPASSTSVTANAPTTAPPAAPSTTAQSAFSFAAPPQPAQAQPAEKETAAPSAGGGDLLSRLAPAPAQPATQPAQPTSSFSFAKPAAAEASKSTSLFGNLSTPQNAPQTTAFQPTPAPAITTAPKFNFGFGNKQTTTTPTTTPTPAAESSSLSNALGKTEAKPGETASPFSFNPPAAPSGGATTTTTQAAGGATSTPKFSFGTPTTSTPATAAPATSTAAAGGATTTPKFSFGTPASSTPSFGTANPFAPKPATAASTTTPASSTPAAPSNPFGLKAQDGASTASPATSTPSTTVSAPSAFAFGGTGAAGSTSSPFGTSNTFGGGGTSNAFGIPTTAKAGEATKPSPFSFGAASTPSTTTPAATPAGETATKPSFSFGTPSTTTPASSTPAPSAGFGAFTFGDSGKKQESNAGQSAFGKPSTGLSAFGFGTTGTSSSAPSAFSFGKAPASTGQQQQ